MKKLFAAIVAVTAVFAATAAMAEDEAAFLPTFAVTLNGQKVDSQNREYPLFVYRDITYFPMTYHDCRFLGLTTDWNNEARSLSINKENIAGMYRDYSSDVKNPDSWTVRPVEVPAGQENRYTGECVESANFDTYVNDRQVGGGDYPLMLLRGVTYFPLTWEYAHDMFGWEYNFDENGLTINSDNYHPEALDLPGFDLAGLDIYGSVDSGKNVALYNGYYFYQAGQEIRRAPADNTAAAETVYTMPLPPYYSGAEMGATASFAEFSVRDGELRMTFTDVDIATFVNSYNLKYDPAQNTFVEDDRPTSVSNATGPSTRYYYADDIKVKIGYYASYSRNGSEEVSLQELGYAIGCRLVGHKLYLTCGDPANGYPGNGIFDLYKVDMDTGEITLIAQGVNEFWAFEGPEGDLVYIRAEDGLTRPDTGVKIEVGTDEIETVALVGGDLAVLSNNGGAYRLRVFPKCGEGQPREILSSEAYIYYGNFDGGFYAYLGEELPGDEYRIAVLREGCEPYLTADIVEGRIFADGDDLIYLTGGKAVHVTLDRPAELYSTHRAEALNLPAAKAFSDGEYYYYQGGDYNLYRTPVDDLNAAQLIKDFGWEPGKGMAPYVGFRLEGENVIVSYNGGYSPTMSSTHEYRVSADGQLEEIDSWGNGAGNNSRIYIDDELTVRIHDWGNTGVTTMNYTYQGTEYEVSEGAYGQYGNGDIRKLTREFYRVGDYLYFTGWYGEEDWSEDGERLVNDSSLFRLRLGETEPERVMRDVGRFYIFPSPEGEIVIYWREGVLLRLNLVTGRETVMMETELPLYYGVGGEKIAVVLCNQDYGWTVPFRAKLVVFDDYGVAEPEIVYDSVTSATVGRYGELLYIMKSKDGSGDNVGFAAIDPGVTDEPYLTSDSVWDISYNDGLIIYATDSGLKKVNLKE